MNAQTLHCSSCGAAVSSDKPNCAHCGARLACISCPGCFGMMFQSSKFCPHCGGPSAKWDGEDSQRQCPACSTSMLSGNLRGIPLHECGKCYGLWLMHRMNFAHCSGVIVDVCRAHGTWFDANELHRIAQFIRGGGLERSRAKEKSELVDAQRRLRAARMGSQSFPAASTSSHMDAHGLGEVVSAAAELIFHFLH
jgi:Zn-finger nucleic acid-binding protein